MDKDFIGPLPYTCPDHFPTRPVHSWEVKHYVMNGYPAGEGVKVAGSDEYRCSVCGRELSPP